MTNQHAPTASTSVATSAMSLPMKLADLKTRMVARLLQSEALNLVANMLKSYPASNQRDLREYVAALAGALCRHPREIAEMCAHPVSGVVTECMFKPTVADVKRWCDRAGEPLLAAYRDAVEAQRVANDPASKPLTRENRETIEQLRARHGRTFGLKNMPDAVERVLDLHERQRSERERSDAPGAQDAVPAADARNKRLVAKGDAAILAEYRRLRREPIYAGGILISPALLQALAITRHEAL